MEIYSPRKFALECTIWLVTMGLAVVAKDPLKCLQCKNYDKFFTDPIQSRVDCSDASNYVETTCDASSNFCLKAIGKVSGNGRLTPGVPTEGNTGANFPTGNSGASSDIVLRGCVGPEALLVFNPDGNSYRSEGTEECNRWDAGKEAYRILT
ncbi:hypothetical protein RvY_07917-2 [Ramazzottius varieornatus]|uniref:Uncharacterized protein n=1 Tax=Ramazzottius varieornatus TaxID=947166 RepID=A0A1D1V6H5_RAMVA|nr:hypothetical protein RvY_07917-2 [Ramazzottius varieornatus]